MSDKDLFLQLDLVRERTLKQIESVTETTADIIPPGHRNSLRWNLGHIFTVQESLCLKLSRSPFSLPETYPGLFGNGTKPADWQIAPPTLEALLKELTEQPLRIKEVLSQRLDEKLPEPFRGIETVRGSIGFSLYHEGVHTGVMMSIRKGIL